MKHSKKFTQPQLFAILVLRQFFKTDYRGIIALLKDMSNLRESLGLEQLPQYSTLCYAEQRLLKSDARGNEAPHDEMPVRLAREAVAVASEALPTYSAVHSSNGSAHSASISKNKLAGHIDNQSLLSLQLSWL